MADKDYCGIVFIAGCTSWAWGSSPAECAKAAAKQCRKDWGKFFKISGNVRVNIYDMRGRDGWEADERGVIDSKTGERLICVALIEEKNPQRHR